MNLQAHKFAVHSMCQTLKEISILIESVKSSHIHLFMGFRVAMDFYSRILI